MNDMAFMCEHAIAGAGGLTRTDLAGLNLSLRRNINSARGYRPPIELAALHRVPDVNAEGLRQRPIGNRVPWPPAMPLTMTRPFVDPASERPEP